MRCTPLLYLITAGTAVAILGGVVNFLPHPSPPLTKGREEEIQK